MNYSLKLDLYFYLFRFMKVQLDFALPSVSSLKSAVRNVMRNPGPCPTILASIKSRLRTMNAAERFATLSIDGMHLTRSIRYKNRMLKLSS